MTLAGCLIVQRWGLPYRYFITMIRLDKTSMVVVMVGADTLMCSSCIVIMMTFNYHNNTCGAAGMKGG
jgi:hypothetical protein